MKKQGYILQYMMLGLFVLLAVGVGHGQSGIRVSIPFDFSVGAQTFSGGEYNLTPLAMFPHTVLLQDQSGQILAYIGTNSVESRDLPISTKLVFNRYSGKYFLYQIWEKGSEIGRETMKSPVEIQMAKSSPPEPMALLPVPGQ
jgi:hypothetical protein